jgi:hypothetical protein
MKIYDYSHARKKMTSRLRDYPDYPRVFVSWDNTPRPGEDGIVFINATPEAFEDGVREAASLVDTSPAEQGLDFLSDWNEWAEGNYLEPDRHHSTAYLQALSRAYRGLSLSELRS